MPPCCCRCRPGHDPLDPLSLERPGHAFAGTLGRDLTGLRIAWTPDLNLVPVDPEVATRVAAAAETLRALGCRVTADCPDLDGAMEVVEVQRAAVPAVTCRALDAEVPGWRDHARETTIWKVDRGLALRAEDVLRAEVARTEIYRRVVEFFTHYDALLLPAAPVAPFPLHWHWVREIAGRPMSTYIDWMTVCCAISVTGLPAISVPAGFTAAGLPVGVQMVGGPHDDLGLLQLAHELEQATLHHRRHPDIAL
jgi:amidase